MPKRTANTDGDRDKPGNAGGVRGRKAPSARVSETVARARHEPWKRDDGLPYPRLDPQPAIARTPNRYTVAPPRQVVAPKPLGPPAHDSSRGLTRFAVTLFYVPRFVRHLYRRLRSRMPFRLAWTSARARMRQYSY